MARSRIEIAGDALEHQSDADLAVRASNGDREAFEELYRRHSRTAMRVAYRVTGNIHDAGDAVSDAFARVMQALPQGRLAEPTRFRSYLLTSTRHAAVDVLRRAGRAIPHEDGAEPAQTTAGPSELLMDRADNALVAAAFRALPERWRSVLWLTEVEGIPAREAATMLGVSPNGVAQLAVRARAGLRERYLQAHLPEVDGDCRDTVQRLGAYVGGALAPRDTARVDQHLASCDDCRARRDDLEQIGTTLRKAALPLPLIAGGGIGAKLVGAAERVTRSIGAALHSGADSAVARVAPVGAAAAAVFVASIAGVGIVKDRQAGADVQSPAPVAAAPVKSAPVATAPQAAAAAPTAAAAATSAPATAAAGTVRQTRQPSRFTAPAESAAPVITTPTTSPSTTPTTTPPPPPAQHEDDEPIVDIPDLPDSPVDLPETPVVELPDDVVPELPEVPELPGLPVIGEVVEGVTGALPIDVVALQMFTGAADFSLLSLWLDTIDEPLPSPDAPGLPV